MRSISAMTSRLVWMAATRASLAAPSTWALASEVRPPRYIGLHTEVVEPMEFT
jgi:hypothetical protein